MEVRLGQVINKVGNSWVHMQEGRRLDREEKETTREFQWMLKRFGGASGTEVTLDQVREYLATDLRSVNAISDVTDFRYSAFKYPMRSSRSPLVQRLERAQDLQTPEGKTEAIKQFNETKERDVSLAGMLLDLENKRDPQVVEYERRIKAYDMGIRILSS